MYNDIDFGGTKVGHACADCLDELKVTNPEVLGCCSDFFIARSRGNFAWRKRIMIAFVTAYKIPLLLSLLFVDWRFVDHITAVVAKQSVTVGRMEMLLELGGRHTDQMEATSRGDAR